MEKTEKKINILSGLSLAFAGGLLVYLLLATFGVFNNFLSWDARQAGLAWKVPAVILIGVAFYQMWKIVTGKLFPTTGSIGLVWLALVFGVMASTGFKGTGGDIKQRVTYLDLQGRVSDTAILFNCYDDFYHFSSDTGLKNYVRTYGELPGRNTWNPDIRLGSIPKSKAPRSDEYTFVWHTGSYEGKIPKDCGK